MGLGVFEEGMYPAAVLRRTGAAATGASRVDPAGIHDQDLLETQVQSPAVGEVVDVDVDEPFGRPSSHVGEADQVGIVAEADTADVAD